MKDYVKKGLVTTLALVPLAMGSGCASFHDGKELSDVMRNNAVAINYATTQKEKKLFTIDEKQYQKGIDLVQRIGESGLVDGFNFPSNYSQMATSEETKEQIAKNTMNSYTPGQMANIVVRYGESMAGQEMDWWRTDATIKDVTSSLFWLSVASFGSSSSSGGSTSTTPTDGGTLSSGSNSTMVGPTTFTYAP